MCVWGTNYTFIFEPNLYNMTKMNESWSKCICEWWINGSLKIHTQTIQIYFNFVKTNNHDPSSVLEMGLYFSWNKISFIFFKVSSVFNWISHRISEIKCSPSLSFNYLHRIKVNECVLTCFLVYLELSNDFKFIKLYCFSKIKTKMNWYWCKFLLVLAAEKLQDR